MWCNVSWQQTTAVSRYAGPATILVLSKHTHRVWILHEVREPSLYTLVYQVIIYGKNRTTGGRGRGPFIQNRDVGVVGVLTKHLQRRRGWNNYSWVSSFVNKLMSCIENMELILFIYSYDTSKKLGFNFISAYSDFKKWSKNW